MNIFSAFAIVREILKPEIMYVALLPHTIVMIYQFIKSVAMAHVGSSTTEEAEKTPVILARIMSQTHEASNMACLRNLLSQIRTRNLNLQNELFRINWNIILGVSIKILIILMFCYCIEQLLCRQHQQL